MGWKKTRLDLGYCLYLSRQNFRYTNSKYDAFITHTYNYSYIRGINSDNFIGIGGGIKKEEKDKFKVSLSYAILYQFTDYKEGEDSKYIRHSLRTRVKLNSKKFQILSEFYFQPTFNNLIDHIISGNNQIILFPKKEIDEANDSVPVYLSPYFPKKPSQLSSKITVFGNSIFNLGTFTILPML